MKSLNIAAAILLLVPSSLCAPESNLTEPPSSSIILPATFKPPQAFKNINLLRTVNLEKGYPRESINVVIENIDSSPQDEYFLPFDTTTLEKVGGLEVRDKKQEDLGPMDVKVIEFDSER
jgi:oligosaccharyltransferase complex subunit alpha (ribophorin I)